MAPGKFLLATDRRQIPAWIKSRVLNQIALVADGAPVWPGFRRELHVASDVFHPVAGHQIWIGVDFGRSPGVPRSHRPSIIV